MSSADFIQNTGNPAGTQILEATASTDPTSAVVLNSRGQLALGNASRSGQISLDNGQITTDGSGNANAQNLTTTGSVISGNTTRFTYGPGNKIGLNQMAAFSNGTFTSAGAPETINHLFQTTPKIIFVWKNSGTTSATHKEITNITSTQFTIQSGTTAGQKYGFLAIG